MPATRDTAELPVAEQPEIVEQPLGVREYWFETFRRVVVVPENNNCYLISMDVYSRQWEFDVEESLELNNSRLLYYHPKPESVFADIKGVKWCEIVGLETTTPKPFKEVISFRIWFCGAKPSRELVWKLYRRVVAFIEGRDPAKQPLKHPKAGHFT